MSESKVYCAEHGSARRTVFIVKTCNQKFIAYNKTVITTVGSSSGEYGPSDRMKGADTLTAIMSGTTVEAGGQHNQHLKAID